MTIFFTFSWLVGPIRVRLVVHRLSLHSLDLQSANSARHVRAFKKVSSLSSVEQSANLIAGSRCLVRSIVFDRRMPLFRPEVVLFLPTNNLICPKCVQFLEPFFLPALVPNQRNCLTNELIGLASCKPHAQMRTSNARGPWETRGQRRRQREREREDVPGMCNKSRWSAVCFRFFSTC